MKIKKKIVTISMLFLIFILITTGCARDKELERINRQQAATIASLNNEIARLNEELNLLAQAREELARAKTELEKKLGKGREGVEVTMEERGLVVTVLERVLFDSGKAILKPEARDTLEKVAEILAKNLKDNLIYVEGHTDNEPIKYSGWKSNWELSTARATEVIHYFIDEHGIKPQRLVASGFGEFHPVASNETGEGRTKNRRVEIVISPKKYEKRELEVIPEEEEASGEGTEGYVK